MKGLLRKALAVFASEVWQNTRAANLVEWGTLFPVYTNLACIGKVDPLNRRNETTDKNS
jgi:hypothetical protein